MINKELFIKSYIQKNVLHEKKYKLNIISTYSHNDYFKSEKSFYDLLQINNWKEGNKIELLLNLWRDKSSGK